MHVGRKMVKGEIPPLCNMRAKCLESQLPLISAIHQAMIARWGGIAHAVSRRCRDMLWPHITSHGCPETRDDLMQAAMPAIISRRHCCHEYTILVREPHSEDCRCQLVLIKENCNRRRNRDYSLGPIALRGEEGEHRPNRSHRYFIRLWRTG